MTSNPRVQVSGQPIVTQSDIYAVTGCGFTPPSGNGPCVTATFTIASTRLFASGQPVILQSSISTCSPTGTPLIPVQMQTRVLGS